MTKPLRTISWGVGVQSTALVVLAAQGRIDFQVALFANVGDDSEDPRTLEYFEQHARPWAESHGIEVHVVQATMHGEPTTLMQQITHPDKVRTLIPVRSQSGNLLSRNCTTDFKVRPMHKWLKEHGASKDNPATVAIGISTDEIERAGRGKTLAYEIREYPLLDLGMNRGDCQKLIADAGLPVPPKSSCFFCPFHNKANWSEMRRDRPELFDKAVALESHLIEREVARGKGPVYLTDYLKPLADAVKPAQDTLPWGDLDGPQSCDSGYCWT